VAVDDVVFDVWISVLRLFNLFGRQPPSPVWGQSSQGLWIRGASHP
jgi:hypothetical protein